MDLAKNVGKLLWAVTLLLTLTAVGWSSVSHEDIVKLKAKVEAGQTLTAREVLMAEEINATTSSRIDLNPNSQRAFNSGMSERGRGRGSLDEYEFETVPYTWVDISAIGTNTGLVGDDQNAGPFDFGFTFTYFDNNYTSTFVCSNGWVSPTDNGWQYTNGNLPSPEVPNNAIYGFWDDLFLPNGGQVMYYADAANQRFIVSWLDVPHINGNGNYTYQIILTSGGEIYINYQSLADVSSCTVGIENESGTVGVQAYANGAGTAPANSTSFHFSEGEQVFVPVSGHVTLDGGTGVMTAVTVRATGQGAPNVHPLANGNYSIPNVQIGNRSISAELTGYGTQSQLIAVVQPGNSNINFTLRRNPPPAPTSLTAVVNSGTGVVTLDWDTSTDPLVDNYRVYRKLAGDTAYALIQTVVPSNGTDQLTTPGIYDYVVTAVDIGASTPVVSGRSNRAEVLYGELPPGSLSANGNFDNKIRLNWQTPGAHPPFNIYYDDSTSEAWFHVTFPNEEHDYFAVRFTPPSADSAGYPLAIQDVDIFMENSDPIPNVWVCADTNGAPNMENPLRNWTDIGADGSPGWIHAVANGEVFLDTPADFWVVMQFPPGVNGAPGVGSDNSSPDNRSYWTWDNTPGIWNPWQFHDWMMRAWVGGPHEGGFVLSNGTPSGYRVDQLPSGTVAPTYQNKATGEITQHVGPTRKQAQSGQETFIMISDPSQQNPFFSSTVEAPYIQAPATEFQARNNGGRSLDEVTHYNVYRNGVNIAQPVPTNYEDFAVVEGTVYAYYVTATYDNNVESGPTGTVNRAANMAPGAPQNVNGETVTSTTIRISWTNPTTNADGTPCVDLAGFRVYRNGTQITSVAPGVHEYIDTPPQPNQSYVWEVRGFDEVPNVGPAGSFTGSVVSPWQEEIEDWEDISGTGTPIAQCDDCIEGPVGLGFNVSYYGMTYSAVKICSNGWITFSDTNFGSLGGPQIPDPSEPNAIIAAFWSDMYPIQGQLKYYADAANQQFIVSWINCPRFPGNGSYSFQIVIHQDGGIVVQYDEIDDNSPMQLGIENETGQQGIGLWNSGVGDWTPVSHSAVSFFGSPPVYVPVSGTVTLDGGAGNVTQVNITANGANHPTAHPAANGTYSMPEVVVGTRRFIASLANYISDTNIVAVPNGGLPNNNFVLRRVNPPVPTGLTGSVNSSTGLVTLDWATSTDPLVDVYRVYRRLQGDQNWTQVATVVPSNGTDQLTADGVYQYTVTAVDNNASTPVESGRSTPIEVLYGEIPPTNLVANGRFDDHIHLSWLSPGSHPSYYLFYDDSTSEAWFRVAFPNGDHDYFAVRFTPPSADSASYPLQIQTASIYMETNAPIPNVWVAPGTQDAPDMENAYANWTDISADGSPGWINAEAGDQSVFLDTPDDFWVIMQFPPGQTAPGCGSDQSSPDNRSYWTWDNTPNMWNPWSAHDWMMRVWLGGPRAEGGFVLSSGTPSGYDARRVPSLSTTPMSSDKDVAQDISRNTKTNGPVRKVSAETSYVSNSFNSAISGHNPFNHSGLTPYSQAPALERHHRDDRNSLDDILYYIVFHNGTDVGHPTGTSYDYNVPAENVDHSFFVKAHYDNNQDSGPSNTVTARANMAPGAPTNIALQPQGQNSMRITWTDPTQNADGTPCVDLAGVKIYRDDTFLSDVAVGVQQYIDTPPDNQTRYTWSVRGRDEVPNIGPAGSANGAVVSPWEVTDFEWVDITGTGTAVVQCDDCAEGPFPLGFSYEYYGQNYTEIYICSNGWTSFTQPPFGALGGPPLPNPQEPNNIQAIFWTDMFPTAGQCKYFADAAGGRFIISWDDCPRFGGGGSPYSFQIIVDESGSLTYNYQTMPAPHQCEVGVENQDGSAGEGLWDNTQGDFEPNDNTAVVFWGGPAGELAGTVRVHSSNALLAGVHVWATGWADTAVTDAQGNYILEMDPGTYVVHFERAAYCDTVFTGIVIEDGNTTVRNARMLAPAASFNITSINETSWPGHDVIVPFNITNQGGNCPLEFTVTDPVNWITSNPATGNVNPGQSVTVNVTILGSLLGPGEHQSQVTINNGSANTPYVIPVTLFMAVSADDPNAPLPTEFALHQNYPNPFNATTAIRFDLPKESRVSLKIFNLMGQEVANIVDDKLAAGRHEISYTASDLPSGMYVIRMEAESFTALNKMVLLK